MRCSSFQCKLFFASLLSLLLLAFYSSESFARISVFGVCSLTADGPFRLCSVRLNNCSNIKRYPICFINDSNFFDADSVAIKQVIGTASLSDYCVSPSFFNPVNNKCSFINPAPLADSQNNADSSNNTCNPINISSGNKFYTQVLYQGNGVHPLELKIYFNSNSSDMSWRNSYNQHLVSSVSNILARRDNGSDIKFIVTNGIFTNESQRVETLLPSGSGYELTLADNTKEYYSSLGQINAIVYPSGVAHQLTYSQDNNTVTITRLNETLVLDLVDGNVVKATLPDNSEINYTWDTSGTIDNLTQVTYADGSTKTYLYENTNFPHYVTGILDENGNRISSVEYDSQGRAISSEVGTPNSGINRTQIQYHTDGTRTVTSSLGKQNTYHFTQFNGEYKMTQVEGHASANCAAANQAYTYDANGFMASKTDWEGNVTTYVHNSRGLETSRTEASGTVNARTITTEWHPTFNLRTKITEPERETVFTYNTNGQLISQEVTPQ